MGVDVMAKKNIKTILRTNEKETVFEGAAVVLKNQIQYIENNFKMVIDIADDCATMVRKNVDYELFFHFEKDHTYGTLTIHNRQLPLDLALKKLELSEHKIHIVYLFLEEEYDFRIEY